EGFSASHGDAARPAPVTKSHNQVAKNSFADDLNTVILAMLSSQCAVRGRYRRRTNAADGAGALSRGAVPLRTLEGSHYEALDPRGPLRGPRHPVRRARPGRR